MKNHKASRSTLIRHTLALGTAALLGALSLPAAAQQGAWPNKPVRLVVGFAPGGGTDVAARVLGQMLTESTGQSFIVDNKPGGSGNVSAADVAKAAPDGYTLLVGPTTIETANPSLFKSTLVPSRDLTPVMGIGRMQLYVVARPTLEVNDVKGLIAMAKAQPGKMNYASSGTGTVPHLGAELFKVQSGVSVTHIPYRGSAPALQDVMAGQADYVFDPGTAFPHIKSGKVKLLGVASDQKSPFFPDAPTYADIGLKNASMDVWFGVWAPNNMPADVSEKLSREITKALASPVLKERFNALGLMPAALATPAFRKLLSDEGKTLSELIKAQNIVVE